MKSNKLFQVKCKCDALYNPDEVKQCPSCNAELVFHKELLFDSDKFLNILYGVEENANEEEKTMDLLFDVYWHLHNNFHIMNDIIAKADVTRLSGTLMIGLLSQTFKYDEQVPNHIIFYNKVEARFREMGKPEKDIEGCLKGLKGSGNYWKNMEILKAPQWITGPKPE